VDAKRGQCETCGNVNPEQIFNIIEAKVVDEYGQLTNKRKITPVQWNEHFLERFKPEKIEEVKEEPPKSLHIPSKIKQTIVFTIRDTLSKVSNTQYLMINLLEAPVLALILAFIIRYKSAPSGKEYLFRFNENIPAFLLMSIIVALFMGLSVSAEEIIRDRKILKRESFLNLSWGSYLQSKLIILFSLSAIQTLTFVVIGNLILEIREMTLSFWLVLFSVSCMSNILGLNVSSAFKSAVTVYILIPLLLIPQMILSGLLFNFDKLNDLISTKGKVPIVADLMASRWAYEAMAVYQFKNNSFEAPYYTLNKFESKADFKSAYLVKELERKRKFVYENYQTESDSVKKLVEKDFHILRHQLENEPFQTGLEDIDLAPALTTSGYNDAINQKLEKYLEAMQMHYQEMFNKLVAKKEEMIFLAENDPNSGYHLNTYKNKYFNQSLSDLVTNATEKDRILEYKGTLLQQIDPVYNDPGTPAHALDYRAHFFAPQKHFLGITFDTYYFNIIVIWLMSVLLYLTLYYEWLSRFIQFFGNLGSRFWK
jgi:ABC transport system ATP-binding/permease protein